MFHRARAAAGRPDLRWHDLRHSRRHPRRADRCDPEVLAAQDGSLHRSGRPDLPARHRSRRRPDRATARRHPHRHRPHPPFRPGLSLSVPRCTPNPMRPAPTPTRRPRRSVRPPNGSPMNPRHAGSSPLAHPTPRTYGAPHDDARPRFGGPCYPRGSRSSLDRRGGFRLRRKNRRGVDKGPDSPRRVLAGCAPSGLTRRAEHYAGHRVRAESRRWPVGSVVSDEQLWARCRKVARDWDRDRAMRDIDLNETLRLARAAELWAVPVDQAAADTTAAATDDERPMSRPPRTTPATAGRRRHCSP